MSNIIEAQGSTALAALHNLEQSVGGKPVHLLEKELGMAERRLLLDERRINLEVDLKQAELARRAEAEKLRRALHGAPPNGGPPTRNMEA